MTIQFTTTEEDVVVWNMYRLFQTPVGRRHVLRHYALVVIGSWLLASAILFLLFGKYWNVGTFAGLSLAIFVGYAVLAIVSARRDMSRDTRKLVRKGQIPYVKGDVRITPRPDGWFGQWSDGEVLRKWSALQSVTDIDDHLVFQWSEVETSLVPKRAFASVAHQQEFLAEIERYRQSPVTTAVSSLTEAPEMTTSTTATSHWYRNRNHVESGAQPVRTGVRPPS